MKKILILSLLISCSQFFMSCENWFDVNPKSQVKNDILFENENGYKKGCPIALFTYIFVLSHSQI